MLIHFVLLKNIKFEKSSEAGTILYVAINSEYKGYILISDTIKQDAKNTVTNLKKMNIKQIMLTGDKNEVAQSVSKELGINEVYSELLPDGKVSKVEELLKQKSLNGELCFVGDGINDSPVLAMSDVGIAMGALRK
jgi:Cd2+/Zn2+-exporting ATPase